MAISFTAPNARWFAASRPAVKATEKAGGIHFDGFNGGNSFTILGPDLVSRCGYGFYSENRIYIHVGFAETLDQGEDLVYRVKMGNGFMSIHSPILENEDIVLPVSGAYRKREFSDVRLVDEGDVKFAFLYTPPAGKDEVHVETISAGDWLSEAIEPVLINVR